MALSKLALLLCALVALIFVKIGAGIIKSQKNRREAVRRGCLPPAPAPNRGLFGLRTLKESIRATRDEWGPLWMHQALNSVGRDVHTVRAPIFDYEILITRDVENVKAIFATQGADFDIGPHREKTFKSLLGLGVMTGRGEAWKHSRALVRPQFARDNIADLPMLQGHIDSLLKPLQAAIGADGWTEKLDLGPMFFSFTLDVGTEFLFGQSVHLLDPDKRARLAMTWAKDAPDLSTFGYHLDSAKCILDRRGALAKYGWLLRDKEYPTHCKKIRDFADYFVNLRLNQTDDEKVVETASGKTKFILLDELAKSTRDPVELRSELLNVLLASRDTTAALMGWFYYFLARNPQVFKKLRKEVIDAFGTDSQSEISYVPLTTCTYLNWTINEAMRLGAVIPMNERAALRDTTLPRGGGPDGMSPVFVPKGVQILIPAWSMQHREDIWGPDVEEFKPERWENRKFGWDFIPFGGGLRQCLGQQLARTEISYVTVRLLQTFDSIENMEPPGPMKMHHTIENRSGTGVQVRLRAASMGSRRPSREADLDIGFGIKRRESVEE